MTTAPHIPALVLGSHVTALGALRVLARRGVQVYVLGETTPFVTRSRWYRPLLPRLPESPRPGPLAAALEGFPFDRGVLFPCSDDWLTAVAGLPASIKARFPAPVAEPALLEVFLDKWLFASALEHYGVPGPRTLGVEREADLDDIPETELSGWFLKPRSSQAFFRRFGVKAFELEGRAHAAARLAAARAEEFELVLQEYVPGPPDAHVFLDGYVDQDGRIAGMLARRRLRMDPPDFGNSSYLISVPLSAVDDARESVERLVAALGYRGIFSVELKRDDRDGRHRALELNARPWWYVEFAARCGVDVCTLAYRDLLDLPLDRPRGYRVGARCVFPSADARAFRRERRAGSLSTAAWLRSLVGAGQPLFSSDDPLPALAHLARLARRRMRRA